MMTTIAVIAVPGAAWAAGAPPVPQQRGNVNLGNFTDASVTAIADDGSVAIVSATNSAKGADASSTYFMVTLNDVSITEIGGPGVVSSDGRQVYFVDGGSHKLGMVDVASKQVTMLNGNLDDNEYVLGAVGGRVLISDYSAYAEGKTTLNTYDVKQQRVTASTKTATSVIAFSADLQRAFALESSSSGSSATLHVYDLNTGAAAPDLRISGPAGIDYTQVSMLPHASEGNAVLVRSYSSSSSSSALDYRLDTTTGRLTYLSDHPYALGVAQGGAARYVLGFDGPSGDPANGLQLSRADEATSMSVYDVAEGRAVWTTGVPAGLDDKFGSSGFIAGGGYLGLTNDGRHMLALSLGKQNGGNSGGANSGGSANSDGASLISVDTKTGAMSEAPISGDISSGYGGGAMLSADGATVLVATGRGNDSELLIFSTGVGGSPWTKPQTWIMVGAGGAAAIALIVVVIVLLRRHSALKAAVAGDAGAGIGDAGTGAAVPGAVVTDAGVPTVTGADAVGAAAVSGQSIAGVAAPAGAGITPTAPTVPPAVQTAVGMQGVAGVQGAQDVQGARSVQGAQPQPAGYAHAQPAPSARFCTECGTRVTRPDARFCPGCGHPLQ